MSNQLFLVPMIQTSLPGLVDASGNPLQISVPEYSVNSGDPLYGITYASIPLTGAGITLLATAQNDSLANESDVFSFGSNLDSVMSSADIAALTTILENANVPTSFLTSGITYQSAARTIGQIAQTLQAAAGSGNPIQLGPTINIGSPINAKSGGSINTPPASNDLLASAAQVSGPISLSLGDGFAL